MTHLLIYSVQPINTCSEESLWRLNNLPHRLLLKSYLDLPAPFVRVSSEFEVSVHVLRRTCPLFKKPLRAVNTCLHSWAFDSLLVYIR